MEVITQTLTETIVPFIQGHWEALISILSFIIALVSFVKSFKTESLQNKVNELDIKIKKYELAQHEKEEAEATSSCVEARIIDVGDGHHKMKVWNSGKTTVKNVCAHFKEDKVHAPFILNQDVQPFEFLDPSKNYELELIISGSTPPKLTVVTEWTDLNGLIQSKEQICQI